MLTLLPGRTVTESCKLQGTTHANCGATVYESGSTSAMTTAFDVASIPYGGFQPVTVTATLPGEGSASTGASASATTASATQATATGTKATDTAATSTNTNAALPMLAGKTCWTAGAVAAMAGFVVL